MKKLSFAATFCSLSVMILFICSAPACDAVFRKLYGVNELTTFDPKAYDEFIADIDTSGLNITSFYASKDKYDSIRRLPTDTLVMKDLSQPVQLLYFEGDDLVSFQANCYAPGGLSSLNWNYDKRFESFVPKTVHEEGFGQVHLSDYVHAYPKIENTDKKYTLIITWSRMLEKVSRDAIDIALENVRKFGKEEETVIYLINNDYAFIEAKKD